ncbi:alpha/beta fold hydrolase [Pelistega sp. MC2]|uniref:alpha/beta fold hydrolase n=1 Tax=Pelistega sp. MC2 TaxID=1720297 RepID=UPI0008D948ED|nr:alpha/beta hydrolase [Pelistega sp. MC2]
MSSSQQEPRLKFVTCANPQGFHRMAYWEWGDPHNKKVLICVHGLTRTGRDFDEVARRMSLTHRVICPDVVGRGASDFHINPDYYAVPFYVADMLTLIVHLGAEHIDWLGTSMGGLIGLGLMGARSQLQMSLGHNQFLPPQTQLPIKHFILNDVGPRLEIQALNRIGDYIGKKVTFDTLEEAAQTLKVVSASFGPMSDEHWLVFARAGLKQEGTQWVTQYDLKLADSFKTANSSTYLEVSENLLWGCYTAIDCPILIIHGEQSDLLSAQTVEQMLAFNARATAKHIPLTGHAPALLETEQVDMVQDFLLDK